MRKVFGWERYDTPGVIEAMNELYRNEMRLMMNLFQPSVKLTSKERIGARLRRHYDAAQTPLDRLVQFYEEQLCCYRSSAWCVFRLNPISHSDSIRSWIPMESDRRFQFKAIMDSNSIRSPIPVNPITCEEGLGGAG